MHSFVAPLALVAIAAAAPLDGSQPPVENDGSKCNPETKYWDVKFSEPYEDIPVITSGWSCTSNAISGCGLGKSATHTVSVSHTVSGGWSGTLELTKILSMGLNAGYSYTWGTSDSKAVTSTVECPKGGFSCNMMATPKMVRTTGKVETTYADRYECPKNIGPQDFTITAPYITPNQASDTPEGAEADVNFRVCQNKCVADKEFCDSKDAKSVIRCDVIDKIKAYKAAGTIGGIIGLPGITKISAIMDMLLREGKA